MRVPFLFVWLVAFLVTSLSQSPARAQENWLAGVAKADITPSEPLRLSGYGNRRDPTIAIDDRLYVRALQLSHPSGKPLLVVSLDAIGVAAWMTQSINDFVDKEFGLSRAQVVLCTTHSHTAPHLDQALVNLFSSPQTADEVNATKRYTEELVQKTKDTIRKAFLHSVPVRVSYVLDSAEFAINRRMLVNSKWTGFGTVEDGPVDKRVRLLRVDSIEGKPMAVAYQYACHCTSIAPELNRISGDWAGLSASQIESQLPNSVAIPIIGTGADANPNPRGTYENAVAHGNALAESVLRALKKESLPLPPLSHAGFSYAGLEFDRHSKDKLNTMLESKTFQEQNLAKNMLDILKQKDRLPESYPAPVHFWSFGKELAWVFLGGEVVVDYQIRLERELSQYAQVWVAAYVDDVFAYVASDRILREGGYEVDGSMIYYNQPGRWKAGTEDKLVRAILDIQRQSRWQDRPLGKDDALQSIQVPAGWTIEQLAAEPLVEDPVNVAFGFDGTVWVVEMGDYPLGGDRTGRIKSLRDTNGDGRLDQSQVFLDKLDFPSGVYPWRDGVVIACAPEVFFARDTNGDGVADERRTLLSGFPLANQQHRVHGFTYGLDHKLHFGAGEGAKEILVHALDGSTTKVDIRGCDLALDVDRGELSLETGTTQFIRSHDGWGNWFGNDNSHPLTQYVLDRNWIRPNAPSPRNLARHATTPTTSPPVFPLSEPLDRFNDPHTASRFTSACSSIFCSSSGCGDAMQGAALICEPVHNLVVRYQMQTNGLFRTASRWSEDSSSEWIRSSDPWFRPVRAVNAPDGTIWIVDMYRQVIEHPTWIPQEWLTRLNVRAGENQGRLYRVRRSEIPTQPWGSASNAAANFSQLSNPNLAIADLAQQQLLWNVSKNTDYVEAIRSTLRSTKSAPQKLRCFCILDYLRALEKEDWMSVLSDSEARLVRYALHSASRNAITAEKSGKDSQLQKQVELFSTALKDRLGTMLEWAKRDPNIGSDLVFYLGNYLDEKSENAAEILARHANVGSFDVVVDFVSNDRLPQLVDSLLKRPESTTGIYLDRLVPRLSSEKKAELAGSIQASKNDSAVAAWQFRLARQLLKEPQQAGIRDPGPFEALTKRAWDVSLGNQEAIPIRLAALELILAQLQDNSTQETQRLLQSLSIENDREWNAQAIQGVFRLGGNSQEMLLKTGATLSQELQEQIASLFVNAPKSLPRLLDVIQLDKKVASWLTPSQVETVRSIQDSTIRKRVLEIFGPDARVDRQELVQRYRTDWPLAGNAEVGKQLFEQHCASCHRDRKAGTEVLPAIGPSLQSLSHWTNEAWTVAILDPSRIVEPKYRRVLIETESGGILAGLKIGEDSNDLEVMTIDGRIVRIAKKEVLRQKESEMSLMPDGFEKVLTPEQLASLVKYLRSN